MKAIVFYGVCSAGLAVSCFFTGAMLCLTACECTSMLYQRFLEPK